MPLTAAQRQAAASLPFGLAVDTPDPLSVLGRLRAIELAMSRVAESYLLVNANAAAAAVTVFGGDYIFSQTATAYGSCTLQVLGPDGVTWLPLIAKTASDTGSGTGLALGSGAQVRVILAGTTACNAVLARVPA